MTETERRSAAGFAKRNQLAHANKRPRPFIETPQGHSLACHLIEEVADFLAGKLAVQPDTPPKFMRGAAQQLEDPWFLALAGLAPLLDKIFRGWDPHDESAEMKLKRWVGDNLYHRLCEDKIALPEPWGEEKLVQAGDWLLRQVMGSPFFDHDDNGIPCLSAEAKPYVKQLRERLIAAAPAYAPRLMPPEPWTGWKKSSDGFRATFVRDWRPETRTAIEAAFLGHFEHAQAVNSLASVPLAIDQEMVELVEQFAVDVMGHKDGQRITDHFTVDADLFDARWIGNRVFWSDYNCDRRGRINALGHFNFGRGDHVRSLIRFASGMKLDRDGLYWLEIHCANCYGLDKESREFRKGWVRDHSEEILAIAERPFSTFHKWKNADKPFAYVAACRELAAAWADPENFETRLPISFDGTANGIQHLSLLVRDVASAGLVNLLDDGSDDSPSDAYRHLIKRAVATIEVDADPHADWWCKRFKDLESWQQRKLLKTPIVAFGYSGEPKGAARKIAKTYYKKLGQKEKPPKGAFLYLAEKVYDAFERELRRPNEVMNYICRIAEHCTAQKRFMEWTSPSGFPVANRYQKLDIKRVACLCGTLRMVTHKVTVGVTPEFRINKIKSSSAPNFVHSLDSAHLVKVVNAARSEGIMDLLTVHDCYYGLAPQATRLHEIILEQMGDMYRDNDPLAELRGRNVSDPDNPDLLPVPPKGTLIISGGSWPRVGKLPLDSLVITTTRNGDGYDTRISFSPDLVKGAKNAFG